ncbi:MAG: GxGYxYP family putative glycoside hydrolase [Anaerolineae bacterium]|nr:GxGYxYP family putative glycoside hydrolase [Anaerolineae bacterium]
MTNLIRSTQFLFWGVVGVALLVALYVFLSSPRPVPPPKRLYVVDVSDLHLNHYEHCIHLTGEPDQCDAGTPPPAGKTHQDLLRDYDTLIFLTTLQGIVNREQPQLYLSHDHQRLETPGVDLFWLEKYQEPDQPYGWLAETEIIELEGLGEVLDIFAGGVAGVVLWDTEVPATLNVATTIAGVEDVAVVRAGSAIEAEVLARLPLKRSLVDLFQAGAATLPNSDTPSSGSTKTDAYLWAKENYLDTGRANAQFLAYLLDGWPAQLYRQNRMTRGGVYAMERDYVVQQRGFAFDLSPWSTEAPNDDPGQPLGADAATFRSIVEAAESQTWGGLIKVWGFIPWYEKYAVSAETGVAGQESAVKGEWESTWLFSSHGGYLQGGGGDVFGVAMANVSVHKFGPPPPSPPERPTPAPPTEADLIELGYLTGSGEITPDRTFVLFYAGDYDLVHPTYTLLANYARKPWLDPRRGDLPLAWGFNPAMTEDIPGIMTYLYATQTEADFFVGANSGAGYLNPDALSELQLLRWLGRSRGYYRTYGYDVQGFLLNGNGAAMSQRRLDAFTVIAPVGLLAPDFEMDEPWPRLQWNTPLTALASEALAGTPDVAAEAVHTAYRRTVIDEQRPPFLAFRSAFQSPTFLWGVRDRIQAQDAAGAIRDEQGNVLHPNYTVVDPYTFFSLLERQLAR